MKRLFLWLCAAVGVFVLVVLAAQFLVGVLALVLTAAVASVFFYGLFKLTFRRRGKPRT